MRSPAPADLSVSIERRRATVVAGALLCVITALICSVAGPVTGASAAVATSSASFTVADGLPIPTQDPATSNQKADEILDRREFEEAKPGLFQRAVTWVGDGIARVMADLFVGGVGSALAWLILASAVALVALVIFRVARTVQADPTRPPAPMAVEVRRSPVEWRREAERFEATGEWKAALRCRYRALVADLVARDVVRDLPGHTTGEYRADVSAALPGVEAEFGGASELFERAWYGDRPTGPIENARFRELADQVLDEVDA